ncbi:hypothetical protein GCM10027199_16700 [Amycolatopsis magusensis]
MAETHVQAAELHAQARESHTQDAEPHVQEAEPHAGAGEFCVREGAALGLARFAGERVGSGAPGSAVAITLRWRLVPAGKEKYLCSKVSKTS